MCCTPATYSSKQMNIKSILILCTLLSLLNSGHVRAVPAYPHKVTVNTKEGKAVTIYLKGDENLKYAISDDGYTLLSENDEWWYADIENGKVVRSKFRLMAVEDETQDLTDFKENCQKGIVPTRETEAQTAINKIYNSRIEKTSTVVGKRKALVILMQFRDLAFKTPSSVFDSLFNSIDYHENNFTGSVRDFYQFASQGQLDYISDVYGPYTAINNMRYYGSNTAIGGNDAHAVDLCIEAMMNLPDTVDLSVYDNDNDGMIDNVHIIFAGYGEEAGASSDAIWSHEYPHSLIITNKIRIAGYSCSPELRGNSGNNVSYIGVICHELGHSLGAMDYYDTNYGVGGEYEGTGQWDIMASGSWNDDGRTPPNFNPYVRTSIFGWNAQEILTHNQQIVMPRMETDNAEMTTVYRLNTECKDDYFLLENRQLHGFDTALPGAGLMIYHVHPDIEKYNLTNTINATHPQCLYPVCASYSEPEKKKYGNINSAECPFPGSNYVRNFSIDTNPSAIAWDGSATNVPLQNIEVNYSTGIISFDTGNGETTVIPDDPLEDGIVYKESFENTLTNTLTVNSIRGNSKWQIYKKGDFVVEADKIPEPTDGNGILMLFSGKSNIISEAEAIGKDIAVETNKDYTLTFDISLTSDVNQDIPQFTLYLDDGEKERAIYTLNVNIESWKQIEIPLTFDTNQFRFKFYGRNVSGGIFIDNIRLYENTDALSIESAWQPTQNTVSVYNLNGIYLGNYESIHSSLKTGLYIISEGNETKKILIIN